jgi:hypothetical protein
MKCGAVEREVRGVKCKECSVKRGVSSVTFGTARHFRTKHECTGLAGAGRKFIDENRSQRLGLIV